MTSTRREFLQQTGVSVLGAAALGSALPQTASAGFGRGLFPEYKPDRPPVGFLTRA